MSKLNRDGNIIGRLGALALIAAAGFGLHRLNCAEGTMCPAMRTSSCCAGASAPAPVPAKPAK